MKEHVHTSSPLEKKSSREEATHNRMHTGPVPLERYTGNWQTARPAAGVVQRSCGCGGSCGACSKKKLDLPGIQTKVDVGAPDDVYEQEADRVAEQVTRMTDTGRKPGSHPAPAIQRLAGTTGATSADLSIPTGGGRPLSAATRQYMEPRFHADFSQVRVHAGEEAAQMNREVGARAFTYGGGIWLGAGESETDNRLMAHELAHVVQQGASRDLQWIQRENKPPAPDPCAGKMKTVDIYAVNLPGTTRDIFADVARANTIWNQCCVNINLVGGQSWATTVLDTDAPTGVLNESASVTVDTAELTAMTAHRPGGDRIHVYLVPANTLGDRGGSYGYTGSHTSIPRSVSVTNVGVVDTLAHELGHILLDDASHHADPDNLMASGTSRHVGVDHLDATQCSHV